VHVVDSSNPELDDHVRAVNSVLAEIGAGNKPMITVFNKTDLLDGPVAAEPLVRRTPASVAVSAIRDSDFSALAGLIEEVLAGLRCEVRLSVPQSRNDVVAYIHRAGHVLETSYTDNRVLIRAELDPAAAERLEEYVRA